MTFKFTDLKLSQSLVDAAAKVVVDSKKKVAEQIAAEAPVYNKMRDPLRPLTPDAMDYTINPTIAASQRLNSAITEIHKATVKQYEVDQANHTALVQRTHARMGGVAPIAEAELSLKQKKIASIAGDKTKIDAFDMATLRNRKSKISQDVADSVQLDGEVISEKDDENKSDNTPFNWKSYKSSIPSKPGEKAGFDSKKISTGTVYSRKWTKDKNPNEEVEQAEAESLIENFEMINEVSLGAKIKAYASHSSDAFEHGDMGNDKESEHHNARAEKIHAHILKHHGVEAANHAEKAANSAIFGNGKHKSIDSLSGGLRGQHSKTMTKSGKIPKNTQSAMKNSVKGSYGKRIVGPKGHLPEEVEQIDEYGEPSKYGSIKKDVGVYSHPAPSGRKDVGSPSAVATPAPKTNSGMKTKDQKDTPGNSYKHQCALHVKHSKLGEGKTLHSQHAQPDADGNIAWYDVMFEHGIEKRVHTTDLEILVSESHMNHKKKM